MADTLNAETLKTFRKRRGWSQDELAEKSDCSKEQISRWERGETVRIRKTSRERLCKALGVKWEELTKRSEESETDSWLEPTIRLNDRVRQSTRTGLELVSLIYGVRRADIIEMAPLLFLIAAEKSLQARKQALDAAVKETDHAAASARGAAPHLFQAFWPGYDDDAIEQERKWITERRVFGWPDYSSEDDNGAEYSPYVNYLKKLLEELPKWGAEENPNPWVEEISSRYFGAPDYEFSTDLLQEVTGISGDGESEQLMLRRIQQGYIDLGEVWSKKKELEESDYRAWLKDQHQKVEADIDSKLPKLKLSLPLPLEPSLDEHGERDARAQDNTAPEQQQ
jgi:transcriptional regulator with XRE-family HTH domain